jgi:hypothetical protein
MFHSGIDRDACQELIELVSTALHITYRPSTHADILAVSWLAVALLQACPPMLT